MKSIERRIQRLEKQWLPEPETKASRRVLEMLEAGRRRVGDLPGDSDPAELLPSETEPYLRAGPDIVDMLQRGRRLARLRTLQAEATNPKTSSQA